MWEWQGGVLIFAVFPNITARLSSPPPARRIPPKNPKIFPFFRTFSHRFFASGRTSFLSWFRLPSVRQVSCLRKLYMCKYYHIFSLFVKTYFIFPPEKTRLHRVQTGSSRSYSRFVSKEKELLCPGAFPSPGQLYPTAAPSRSVERTLKPLLQLYEYRNFPHFFRLVRIE